MKNLLYCIVAWIAVYNNNPGNWFCRKAALVFHKLYGHQEYKPIAHLLGIELRDGEEEWKDIHQFDYCLIGRTETKANEVWDGKLLHKLEDVSMGGFVTREIFEMPLPHISQVPDPIKGRMHHAYKRAVP